MPTRSKKRRSTERVYETEPNVKQCHFSAPKRTIRDRQPAWSAPSKYQQTITQMDPFHALFHPCADDEDLEYDEEEETYAASPVGRKRRKVTPEKAMVRKIETRSAAREAVKPEPHRSRKQISPKAFHRDAEAEPSKPQTSLMPPPQTPRTSRKMEVPSSQSPADSPLSTQARTPARYHERSPLKERSTNYVLSKSTPKKVPRWAKKMEVADSFENDENESPFKTPRKPVKETKSSTPRPRGSPYETRSHLSALTMTGESNTLKEVLESSEGHIQRFQDTGRSRTNVVLDSDTDDNIGEDDDEEDKQGLDALIGRSNEEAYSRTPMTNARPGLPNTTLLSKPSPASSIANEPLIPLSESDEASAQLSDDLHRAILPSALQTESQYENAWLPYHPITTLSSSPLSTSPSPPNQAPSTPQPMTVPTQLLPPIPPSQATTTDNTQPPSSSLALPSSPPPMPPPPSSSSPSAGKRWAGFEWDGVRLTDSQLLPESLMRDSVGGPPLDFGLEELEEE